MRIFTWLRDRFDGDDFKFFIGLGLVGYGVSFLSYPWALIVAGFILMFISYAETAVRQITMILSAVRGQKQK